MSEQRTKEARRGFLKGMLVGGGAAVAAIAAGGVSAAPKQPPSAAKPEATSSGYRETAHVRDYYKSAQF